MLLFFVILVFLVVVGLVAHVCLNWVSFNCVTTRTWTLAGISKKVKVQTKYTLTSYLLEIAPMSAFKEAEIQYRGGIQPY